MLSPLPGAWDEADPRVRGRAPGLPVAPLRADGVFNTWGYVKPSGDTAAGVVGRFTTCAATGVLDQVSLVPNHLNLVGPCDLASAGGVY